MVAKIDQIAIPSVDKKTFQLWSEYNEIKKLRKQLKIENLSELIGLEHFLNTLVKATLMLLKA